MPGQWRCIMPRVLSSTSPSAPTIAVAAAALALAAATASDFFTEMCVVRHLFMAFFYKCCLPE